MKSIFTYLFNKLNIKHRSCRPSFKSNVIFIDGKKFEKIQLQYFDKLEVVGTTLITDREYEIKKYKSEIEFLKQKLNSISDKLSVCQVLNNNMMTENRTLIQDINLLKIKIYNATVLIQELEKKETINELIKENTLLKRRNTELCLLVNELEELKNKYDILDGSSDEIFEELSRLQMELKSNSKLIFEKENENKKLRKLNDYRNKAHIFEEMETELVKTNMELTILRNSIPKSDTDITKIKAELENCEILIAEKNAEILKLSEKNSDIKLDLIIRKLKNDQSLDSLEIIEVYADEISRKNKTISELKNKIDTLTLASKNNSDNIKTIKI